MVVSPEKTDVRDDDSAYSGTPRLSEVQLESAVLRSIVETRPVGPHKHVLMIQLQAELERRTAIWMPLPDLWNRVGEMFDVAALDNLNPSPSLPSSPRSLSPVPKSRRHREPETSASPLSNPSHSASPQPSKSAQLINSSYFGPPFTLPYFRLGEEHWRPALDDDGRRRRSRSIASTSTRAEADREIRLNEVEIEMSPDDEADWHTKIYEEDERATKGMDHEAEEKIFSTGIEGQLAVIAEAEERERIMAKPRRRPGRPSKASKDKEDTSELSDAAAEDEEEEEEEAPKSGRNKRPNAGKRKRNSNAKEESEEEKEVKETKTRRRRK